MAAAPIELRRPQTEPTAWIERYQPDRVSASEYEAVRSTVIEIAYLAGDEEWSPRAVSRIVPLVRFLVWFLRIPGAPREIGRILTESNVLRFHHYCVQHHPYGWSQPTLGDYMSRLRSLVRLVHEVPAWASQCVGRRSHLKGPYTYAQIDWWWDLALSQHSDRLRRHAMSSIAYGAGAGADGRNLPRIFRQDVSRKKVANTYVTYVHLAKPDRDVPVLAEWEDVVLELAETAGDDCIFGGQTHYDDKASQQLKRLDRPVENRGPNKGRKIPTLSLSRLRSTWLVHHISAGTRLPELLQVAGLKDGRNLADLIPYVRPMSTSDAHRMLRGE